LAPQLGTPWVTLPGCDHKQNARPWKNAGQRADRLRFTAALTVVFTTAPLGTPPTCRPCHTRICAGGGMDISAFNSSFNQRFRHPDDGEQRKHAAFRGLEIHPALPAFWVCCSITFLLCGDRSAAVVGVMAPVRGQHDHVKRFLGVPSIDGVYWSLFVEMRFYAWSCSCC
jgi:peptidoglycan/LPS O-acetylase OafA/YrhL